MYVPGCCRGGDVLGDPGDPTPEQEKAWTQAARQMLADKLGVSVSLITADTTESYLGKVDEGTRAAYWAISLSGPDGAQQWINDKLVIGQRPINVDRTADADTQKYFDDQNAANATAGQTAAAIIKQVQANPLPVPPPAPAPAAAPSPTTQTTPPPAAPTRVPGTLSPTRIGPENIPVPTGDPILLPMQPLPPRPVVLPGPILLAPGSTGPNAPTADLGPVTIAPVTDHPRLSALDTSANAGDGETSGLPSWLLPAAAGVGLLLLVSSSSSKRR